MEPNCLQIGEFFDAITSKKFPTNLGLSYIAKKSRHSAEASAGLLLRRAFFIIRTKNDMRTERKNQAMLMDVYYEHYSESCGNENVSRGSKIIPYMVLICDYKTREEFRTFLKSKGFRCVDWNHDYPGVLVNMELRRFGLIYRACRHSCVDDRNYTLDEFMQEVFVPWENKQIQRHQG